MLDVGQRPEGERGVSLDKSRHFHGSLLNFTCKRGELARLPFQFQQHESWERTSYVFFERRTPLLSFQTGNTWSSHLRKASSPLWLWITRCCLHALCNLAACSSYRACRRSAGDGASHASAHHSHPSASLSPASLSSISFSQAAFPCCKSHPKLSQWQILVVFLVIGAEIY